MAPRYVVEEIGTRESAHYCLPIKDSPWLLYFSIITIDGDDDDDDDNHITYLYKDQHHVDLQESFLG